MVLESQLINFNIVSCSRSLTRQHRPDVVLWRQATYGGRNYSIFGFTTIFGQFYLAAIVYNVTLYWCIILWGFILIFILWVEVSCSAIWFMTTQWINDLQSVLSLAALHRSCRPKAVASFVKSIHLFLSKHFSPAYSNILHICFYGQFRGH